MKFKGLLICNVVKIKMRQHSNDTFSYVHKLKAFQHNNDKIVHRENKTRKYLWALFLANSVNTQ